MLAGIFLQKWGKVVDMGTEVGQRYGLAGGNADKYVKTTSERVLSASVRGRDAVLWDNGEHLPRSGFGKFSPALLQLCFQNETC